MILAISFYLYEIPSIYPLNLWNRIINLQRIYVVSKQSLNVCNVKLYYSLCNILHSFMLILSTYYYLNYFILSFYLFILCLLLYYSRSSLSILYYLLDPTMDYH